MLPRNETISVSLISLILISKLSKNLLIAKIAREGVNIADRRYIMSITVFKFWSIGHWIGPMVRLVAVVPGY